MRVLGNEVYSEGEGGANDKDKDDNGRWGSSSTRGMKVVQKKRETHDLDELVRLDSLLDI
jgi:hypothetical protein